MKSFFVALTRNTMSLVGSAIVTASAILIITLFLLETFGLRGSPYIGILAYLILPGIFVLGLLLIPIGIWRQRRRDLRAQRQGAPPAAFPVLDFNEAGPAAGLSSSSRSPRSTPSSSASPPTRASR